MRMRGILVVGVVMAVVLLLGTGFSGTVNAKSPEKLDTVEKVQNKINADFMSWYKKNANRLPALSEKNIKGLFAEFLKENPNERSYLRMLTSIEEETHRNVKIEKYSGVVILSSQDYEKVRVTITYYKVNIAWWTITYGEDDKIETYMHGKVAQDFYDQWENAVTWGGIADAIIGFGLGCLDIPHPVSIALGAALLAIGLFLTYEGTTMSNYYESTGWHYLWMVLNNNYYYPWVPGFSLVSSTGLYGYNAEHHSTYTFWWNVPWIATGGLAGYVYSGYLSNSAHNWVNEHGTGWVYVR